MNRRLIFIFFLVLLALSLLYSWRSFSNHTTGTRWANDPENDLGKAAETCATAVVTVTQTAEKALTTYTRVTPSSEFSKFAGKDEPFPRELLSQAELDLVNSALKVADETPREKRLKRFYNLNGAKDWLDYINSLDDDTIPPLTKFTQDYIYKHQFPDSCKDKQFVVMNHFRDKNGMGTVFHGAGHILGLALRNNRILLWNHAGDNAPGRNFIEPGCGGSPGYEHERSLDCIFEKISSCTLQDVTPENSVKVEQYWGPPNSLTGVAGSVPPVLGYAMKQLYPDIAPDGLKYWWRTQSVGFLMRLNGEGMRRVKELRTAKMHHAVMTHGKTKSVEEITVPFPLPAGTFSMHVRHGDKAVEMNLVPMSKYIEVAHEYIAQNPLTSLKSAFISTEDNAIFEEAKTTFAEPGESTTSMKDWVFYYSDIPRLNGGPEEQLNAFGNRTEMTCKWLQQLIMALECDLVIGTRGSGWNRMIDELRCVWGTGAGGCKAPFMEVGPFEDWGSGT
ncbi:hypothetical protein L211DRAFT_851351 [Terfezia boudieri ATCC MYA-4762]|uniref:Uncharacterized protein n=1 Tax=Terfezia boudieri ATCC MYA-4762 TaxID=1051890 RepID=A0A3N4LFH8_9PEZI|nr:hypothetical protein L211DRAFT_851351 [Terfezia boudieri ATCC MYA-4762]